MKKLLKGINETFFVFNEFGKYLFQICCVDYEVGNFEELEIDWVLKYEESISTYKHFKNKKEIIKYLESYKRDSNIQNLYIIPKSQFILNLDNQRDIITI